MKILYSTDPHWRTKSSMISDDRSAKYSHRLDSLVSTYKYKYDLATSLGVDLIVNGGDLIDKPLLTSLEAMAMKEVVDYHPPIPEVILVGNHDSIGGGDNITSILGSSPYIKVYNEPTVLYDGLVSLLPYTTDYTIPLSTSLAPGSILFSHVDLIGTRFGPIVTTSGFDPVELTTTFRMTINGHLHTPTGPAGFNGIYPTLVNAGAITGSGLGDNFDAHPPSFFLIDTDAGGIVESYSNPYALRYYTAKVNSIADVAQFLSVVGSETMYGMCIRFIAQDPEQTPAISAYLKEHNHHNLLSYSVTSKLTRSHSSVIGTDEAEEYTSLVESKSVPEILAEFTLAQDPKTLPESVDEMMKFINDTYTGGGGSNE